MESNYLKIVRLNKTTSTNDYARKLAEKGEREITVVLAREQTEGRGRLRRKWMSYKDKGLYASFLFRPDKELEKVHLLGMLVALSAVKGLTKITAIKIKWPNDLMIDEKKIGGVLLEAKSSGAKPDFVIVGLGININNRRSQIPQSATSLFLETKRIFSLEKIFEFILKEVILFYSEFRQGNFIKLKEEIEKHLIVLNKKITANRNGSKIKGSVIGISQYGELLIKNALGKITKVTTSQIRRIR
ncbi:MAG: biotin--[acetyl-CoA-carboxylase] ligase [Candidatus Omnitrophota bacterium]